MRKVVFGAKRTKWPQATHRRGPFEAGRQNETPVSPLPEVAAGKALFDGAHATTQRGRPSAYLQHLQSKLSTLESTDPTQALCTRRAEIRMRVLRQEI